MDKEKIVTTRYGHKMRVIENDLIGEEIIKKGIFDRTGIELLRFLLQKIPEAVVLDIGANIGNHSVAIASYVKQLYCFEVQPKLLALLAENLRLNKIENAHIFDFGLSNANKKLPVYIDNTGNLGRSTLESSLQSPDFTTDLVNLKQGDAVLAENNVKKVDLIKIDIEGHEIMALLGLQETIQQHRPIITMEWNNDVTREYFKKFNCQDSLFAGYKMIGVVNRLDRTFWKGKLMRGLRRSIIKATMSPMSKWEPLLFDFKFDAKYENLIICPEEKQYLLEGLPWKT